MCGKAISRLGLAPPLLAALSCVALTAAHDAASDHEPGRVHAEVLENPPADYPPTYFAHSEHGAAIYSHIALMVLAWVFVLPLAVMFSISKSRYTLALQLVFFIVNAVGVLLAIIYNAATPDLYPNNAHHKIGWIITSICAAQILVTFIGRVAGEWKHHKPQRSNEQLPFLPVYSYSSFGRPRTVDRRGNNHSSGSARPSDDSAHGVRSDTESLNSSSASTIGNDCEDVQPNAHKDYGGSDDFESISLQPATTRTAKFTSKAAQIVSCKLWKLAVVAYSVADRIVLPFGFVAMATGVLTFGRFFEGRSIFNGLAHWIKGGVFFWLGLFTLGRWSGSFAELGWAWNLHPTEKGKQGRWKKFRVSAEFVESALIFFYGSTNIFLEHLGGWGGEWSAQDLEHIAITVLFLGGGLAYVQCGMLVESTSIRDLLNYTIASVPPRNSYPEEGQEEKKPPATYEFSVNPIPALVILLLGIMMSSHHQASMISSMIHKQWGNMLLGASFARCFTYVLVFIRPPESVFPSRPPTELLAAFGLMSGGIIFMASSSDTVNGMIHYDLDAMFVYTITMGLVGLLMAWEIVVLALKGWAVRRERQLKTVI